MTVPSRPREIKQLVVRAFLDLGLAPDNLFDLKETVFIDSGRCLARCYRTDELRAVWSISDGVIQFCDTEGTPLRTVDLLEEEVPQVMAA